MNMNKSIIKGDSKQKLRVVLSENEAMIDAQNKTLQNTTNRRTSEEYKKGGDANTDLIGYPTNGQGLQLRTVDCWQWLLIGTT